MAVNWKKIRSEYIRGGTSYRKLAKKHGVAITAVEKKGRAEKWPELRKAADREAAARSVDKIAETQAARAARFQSIADRLLDKLEQAVEQLDSVAVTRKEKIKEIEYGNADRPDKPTKETIREEEKVVECATIIDRKGLRDVAAALRDIREIQMIRSELDDQEQRARIKALEIKGEPETKDNAVEIVFDGGMEEYTV